MAREFDSVWRLKEELSIDFRSAAYVQALERIGAAIESKGTRRYFADTVH